MFEDYEHISSYSRFHCGLVVALLFLSIHNPIDPISPFHAHHIDSHTSSQIDSTSQQLGKALLNALSSSISLSSPP